MASNQELIDLVKSKFSSSVLEESNQFQQACVSVRKEHVVELLMFLRDDPTTQFNFLMDVCGVDYLEMGGIERYAVVYQMYSIKQNQSVRRKNKIA